MDTNNILKRAKAIATAKSIENALSNKSLSQFIDATISEIILLGLIKQNVKKFFAIFGHGTTDVGEILRIYEDVGLVKTYPVHSEVEAVHAATALRWTRNEKSAVITSIGPGALHALAGSLVPLSNGVGVWFLLGDETTEDEGPNMQQIPRNEQELFYKLFSTMNQTYRLHTPGAVATALRKGLNTVDHPFRQGPFYMLIPMNIQPKEVKNFNLRELPKSPPPKLGAATCEKDYELAVNEILKSDKTVVKVGGGAKFAGKTIGEFLELADAFAVTSPLVSGSVKFNNPRNMTVGGSKGSLSGNFAMEEADLLIALGTRFVCQSDSSRTGYPNVKKVININGDIDAAMHYGDNISFIGDVGLTLEKINEILKERKRVQGAGSRGQKNKQSQWYNKCAEKRKQWDEFRKLRYDNPTLFDDMWKKKVLTQPAAIKCAHDWAKRNDVVCFFDAGDVQANGFQIVEDDKVGQTFTDTGASYMGFSVSSLLATTISDDSFYGVAFTGDGSFLMNPQILVDGIQHNSKGCILLLDNRRMGAISGLQNAQYENIYATNDKVEVDYVKLASAVKSINSLSGGTTIESLNKALESAKAYDGLSFIHVPVYWGDDPLGGMGAFGRWNVGNWCENTQKMRHEIGL